MTEGIVRVFTFKRGLLSPIAHDLRIRCERFELQVSGGKVAGRFDARSLRVDGAMRRGRLDDGALSESQKGEIFQTTQQEILRTAQYPEVVLAGRLEDQGTRLVVEGDLTLRGVTRPIRVVGELANGNVRGEVELVPSRWGIQPYVALMGALRLDDRVIVRFDLPDSRSRA